MAVLGWAVELRNSFHHTGHPNPRLPLPSEPSLQQLLVYYLLVERERAVVEQATHG